MRRSRDIVSFDDTCGLCRTSVHWLRRLDWLGRFEFVPSATLNQKLENQALPSPEDLDRALHVFSRDGSVRSGARAVRHIGLRVPLLWLPALGLSLPGVLRWAERGYQWVSTRRHRLSRRLRCDSDRCAGRTPVGTPRDTAG